MLLQALLVVLALLPQVPPDVVAVAPVVGVTFRYCNQSVQRAFMFLNASLLNFGKVLAVELEQLLQFFVLHFLAERSRI